MNFASWVILAIVVAIVSLAVKATFFPKKRKGGCCDVGDPAQPCAQVGCSTCSCASCHVREIELSANDSADDSQR